MFTQIIRINFFLLIKDDGLIIKILKRSSQLQAKDPHAGPLEAQLKN
jgi:hypothetical protein